MSRSAADLRSKRWPQLLEPVRPPPCWFYAVIKSLQTHAPHGPVSFLDSKVEAIAVLNEQLLFLFAPDLVKILLCKWRAKERRCRDVRMFVSTTTPILATSHSLKGLRTTVFRGQTHCSTVFRVVVETAKCRTRLRSNLQPLCVCVLLFSGPCVSNDVSGSSTSLNHNVQHNGTVNVTVRLLP